MSSSRDVGVGKVTNFCLLSPVVCVLPLVSLCSKEKERIVRTTGFLQHETFFISFIFKLLNKIWSSCISSIRTICNINSSVCFPGCLAASHYHFPMLSNSVLASLHQSSHLLAAFFDPVSRHSACFDEEHWDTFSLSDSPSHLHLTRVTHSTQAFILIFTTIRT